MNRGAMTKNHDNHPQTLDNGNAQTSLETHTESHNILENTKKAQKRPNLRNTKPIKPTIFLTKNLISTLKPLKLRRKNTFAPNERKELKNNPWLKKNAQSDLL